MVILTENPLETSRGHCWLQGHQDGCLLRNQVEGQGDMHCAIPDSHILGWRQQKKLGGQFFSWKPTPELSLSLSPRAPGEGVWLESSLQAHGFQLLEHQTLPLTEPSLQTMLASTDLHWLWCRAQFPWKIKKQTSVPPSLLCLWNSSMARAFWAALLFFKTEVPGIKPFFLFLRLHLKVKSLWGDVRPQQYDEAVWH